MFENLLFNVVAIVIGFIILSKAASGAIKRIVRLAKHWNFSEFVISFLFVGVIAIMPELLISIVSAFEGEPSFGAGIVLGSNIADLTLVVGIVALAAGGIKLSKNTFSSVKKLLIFVALPFILLLDGELSRIDGIALLACFLVYLFFIFKRKHTLPENPFTHHKTSVSKDLVILFLEVGVMLICAHVITESAKWINTTLLIPIFFIGVVVAAGTCLPELTLGFKAAKQRHGELGLGDILGNVFADCMLTLGLIAIIAPIKPQYPLLVTTTAFLMFFSMLTMIVLARSERKISKDEGIFLIILYFFFIGIQFMMEQLVT